jgi:tetratricopeptide (TPR) repeat protein
LEGQAQAGAIFNVEGDVRLEQQQQPPPPNPGRRRGDRIKEFGMAPLVVADFVARDELMNAIDAAEASVITAVHGIGGVGKSQLAAKYFIDHKLDYDYAVWVDMRDEGGRAAFREIAVKLDLPTGGSTDLVEITRSYISGSSERWLLVFDNCDHPDSLEPLIPQSRNAKVLVTSRYRHWRGLAASVAVDVFDEQTAVSYLCDRAERWADPDAKALATGLGCLPLALSLAGSFCEQEQMDFRAYHEQLGDHVTAGLASSDPARTDAAVRNLWEQSLSAATATDANARPLMEFLCLLDWTDINRAWFTMHYPGASLRVLYAYSLIELSTTQISVKHNLIADGVASNLRDRLALQMKLVEVFRDAFAEAGPDVEAAGALAEPVRHLEYLTKHHPHMVTTGLIPVLNQAVWQLQDQGEANTEFAARLRDLARTLDGPEHPETLAAALRLAATYWNAGKYQRAAEIERETLAICERALHPDHRLTMMARNNLSASYAKIGRHEEALELAIRAYDDRARVLGADHVQTLNSSNNLANRYAAQGVDGKALDLDSETLRRRHALLGAMHADTLMSKHNLAASQAALGQHQQALELDSQTLAATEHVLGQAHPDTLTSRHNLIVRYASVGGLDEARARADTVLADRKQVLGADHPDTRMTQELAEFLRTFDAAADDPTNPHPLRRFDRRLESLGLDNIT